MERSKKNSEAAVRENHKKVLRELLALSISPFNPGTLQEANMLLRAFTLNGPQKTWVRMGTNNPENTTIGSCTGYWDWIEEKDGLTPLQRRLPLAALVAAMSRAREMVRTCLLVRQRLFSWTPLEVWMIIFELANASESTF